MKLARQLLLSSYGNALFTFATGMTAENSRHKQRAIIMRHKSSKKIFDYWDNLRQGRSAPDRRDIEPSDIRDLLGDTFILEVNPSFRSISFRLAGTRLCSAFGRELKGYGFLGLWNEEDNMEIMDAVRTVYENQQACAINVICRTQSERHVNFELVMLPLLISTSNEIRILGTATPDERPFWLGSDPITSCHLKKLRFIEAKIPTENSFAHASTINTTTSRAEPRTVAHLTVFDGGKVH